MLSYYGNEINWIPKIEDSEKPIYILIAESIEKDIESGKLKSGFKLPSQRVIANYLEINHSTVTRAYKLCEEKGLIKGITGKGTFVSSTAGIPSGFLTDRINENIIEMGMTFPIYEINNKIGNLLSELYSYTDYETSLKYSPSEGHMKHRYIASKWLKKYNIEASVDNIIITSGTQNALSVIFVSIFNKGDRIAVDEFSYPGLKSLAKLMGIILIPIKWDGDGMDVRELENACRRENPKGIYLIPDCQNPKSITMSSGRRIEISKAIDKYNLILIEDGTFSFCMDEMIPPISSIIPDNSLYIHGTSKALNPSFRISYLVAAKKYIKTLQNGINNLTWMASPLTAEILSLFQSTSKYDEIVEGKMRIIKERNMLTDKILADCGLIPAENSLFRYLVLPQNMNDVEIEHLCLKAGLQVFSSKRFATGIIDNHNGIRISISSPKNKEELIRGLEILRDVLKSYSFQFNPIL